MPPTSSDPRLQPWPARPGQLLARWLGLLLPLLPLLPAAAAAATALSLDQVLVRGLSQSPELGLDDRRTMRDQAVLRGLSASRLPQLSLVGTTSFTQVGTSFGFLTNLPTLGDLSLQLNQNGYAVLQNSFATVGLVLDVNLLPLRQGAELAEGRSRLAATRASRRESERQVRFELIRTYRTLQLHQALVPVWEQSLQASSALVRDVEAMQRRGLAPRIDLLRARMLQAADTQGLSQARAQLADSRQQLAALLDLPLHEAPWAADPIAPQAAWPLSLEQTLERALTGRPLLEALQEQQRAQRQQGRAARLTRLPSLSLLVGGGLSADRLSAPVLAQSGSVEAGSASRSLPALEQQASLSGSFYNWGAALLLRQSLYDGGRAAAASSLADRERQVLEAEERLARRRIRELVTAAWSSLQETPAAIEAASSAVQAGERALRDARLRYRAQVEPLTEVLLVQRDQQVAQATLLAALTRQAVDRAALEREVGPPPEGAPLR